MSGWSPFPSQNVKHAVPVKSAHPPQSLPHCTAWPLVSPSEPASQSGGATRSGRSTLEYQRVRTNLSSITRALQLNLSASQRLKWKFQEKGWLSLTANPAEDELVKLVLGRIEQDANQYDEFLAMLRDIEGMDLIVNTLTGMTCNFLTLSQGSRRMKRERNETEKGSGKK